MRVRPVLAVVFGGSLFLTVIAVVVAGAVWVTLGRNDPPPYNGVPSVGYREQLAETLAAFDSGDRARFNALYPYTSAAQRDHVWNECSPISPRARTSTTSVRAYPPVETRTAISGRAKADPSRALSCVVELSPASKNGWWDIVADDAQPSVITPTPHLP